jgi:hypothetical protein
VDSEDLNRKVRVCGGGVGWSGVGWGRGANHGSTERYASD